MLLDKDWTEQKGSLFLNFFKVCIKIHWKSFHSDFSDKNSMKILKL